MLTILGLIAGLAFLVAGAELLVRGGANLAARFGVSSLVIGLTVVAYGTSSPELVVSAKAAWVGQTDIAIGNVVGSNIFNVLFILGISALICPLAVSRQLLRLDVPVMIGVSLLLWGLSFDGVISATDGFVLLALVGIYTWFLIYIARKDNNGSLRTAEQPRGKSGNNLGLDLFLILAGLGALILGAQWFVKSAIDIARTIGVSELVIGLTIVAAGTSMPEVATSIIAAIRGQKDIAVGNVVGSNIYNILGILGLSAVVAGPDGLKVAQSVSHFDLPIMVGVALACFPIFFTGLTIRRWEGALFLAYYAAYTIFLILKSSNHDALNSYVQAMVYFVCPLTLLTLLVISIYAWNAQRPKRAKEKI